MKKRWFSIFTLILALAGCSKDDSEFENSKPELVYPNDLADRISDPAFLRYCYLNWDHNGDGVITKAEAALVTSVDCSGLGISSLSGIEYLPNLTELDCSDNNLSVLDCRYNERLVNLKCDKNRLKKLDLSDNLFLVSLYCDNNPLELLDFGELTNVESYDSPIGQVIEDPFMTPLFTYRESMPESAVNIWIKTTSLTVKAPNAVRMEIFGSLENLTLDGCSSLQWLECNDLGLKNLNMQSSPGLTYLSCAGNMLQRIDLYGKRGLRYLNCYNNNLEALDLSNLTQLTHLLCGENSSAWLDISSCVSVTHLSCSGIRLVSSDFSQLAGLVYLSYENCADATLNVSNNVKLKTLNLGGASGIEALDCSKLIALEWLGCENAGLTSLALPAVPSLTLDCSRNQLVKLDLSPIKKVVLSGGYTPIEELVLGNCVCVTYPLYEYQFTQLSDEFKVTSSGSSRSHFIFGADCRFQKLDLSECLAPCNFQSFSAEEIIFGSNSAEKIQLLMSADYSRTLKISGSVLKGILLGAEHDNNRLYFNTLDLSECPMLVYWSPYSYVEVQTLILKKGQQTPGNIYPSHIEYV